MYYDLAILAAFAFFYSLVASRIEKTPISGAIVFVAFGLISGPHGLGILTFDVDAEGLKTLAELTLALVLFTDAANADLRVLKRSLRIPERLLLLGLPLTILLGFLVGLLVFPHLSLLEVALMATILAPTDAALGKAVVTNPVVPARIREALNVESGLNDGICVPVLLVFLAFAVGSSEGEASLGLILHEFATEIGIGAGVGTVCAFGGVYALRAAYVRGWVGETWLQLPIPAAAMTCFAAAQALGGSGFIAAFVGGLIGGTLIRKHKEEALRAAEGLGDTLAMLTWIVFPVAIAGSAFDFFSWNAMLYAVFSLTVIRMLPVFLSMTGMGLTISDKLFLGWFGPRGLASIVFVVIVASAHLPGTETVAATVLWTIVFSVLGHGLTANPLATKYGASQAQGAPVDPDN